MRLRVLVVTLSLLALGFGSHLCAADLQQNVQVPDQSDPRSLVAVVDGNNSFAFDLYEMLRKEEGNLFFSPYSISTALAMTYAGARGETEEQMSEVLHFSMEQARLHSSIEQLISALEAAQEVDRIELNVANRLWAQEGMGFLDDFLTTLAEQYGSSLQEVDFGTAYETIRKDINLWVEQQTQDKIKDLLKPRDVDRLTRLVLVNAIYFKGAWASPFQEAKTRPRPFWISPDKAVPVPMMHQTRRYPYLETDALKLIELPYMGRELSMLVLLPHERDGLPDLETKLSAVALASWIDQMRGRRVVLSLPKFRITDDFDLGQTLMAMGMHSAFGSNADFTGMIGRKGLFISRVVHKAFVDVSEKGTEAAAATGVVVAMAPPPKKAVFRADHPFLFLIQHRETGSILFIGRLKDPES